MSHFLDAVTRVLRLRRRVAWVLGVAGLVAAAGAAVILASRLGRPGPTSLPAGGVSHSMEIQRAAARNDVCSARNPAGVGLRGEYFAAEGMQGAPMLVRVDGVLDFDNSLDWPAEKSAQRPRSVRWTGWVKAPLSGAYHFHGSVPHMRVTVARDIVAGVDAPPGAQITMVAGRYYPLTIELDRVPVGDMRPIRLQWTAPHGSRYIPPRALLYQPTESVVTTRP